MSYICGRCGARNTGTADACQICEIPGAQDRAGSTLVESIATQITVHTKKPSGLADAALSADKTHEAQAREAKRRRRSGRQAPEDS